MNTPPTRRAPGVSSRSSTASTPATPTAGPGRPKDLAKRAAILEAARTLFIQHGFDGVSMDQIAAGAGVSKLTVYSHFGDKEKLFSAAVASYCEQQLPPALFDRASDVPLRQRLLDIAHAFHSMATSPEAIAALRMLCGPQMAGSPLVSLFWEAGPARVSHELTMLLQRRAATGELHLDPDDEAGLVHVANHLIALIKGEVHARLLLGLGGMDDEAIRIHLASAVDMFLGAYGAAETSPTP